MLPFAVRAEVLYAAGDIGECRGDVAKSAAADTARLVPDGATVLMLGDAAYPFADKATLAYCYAPTWGRLRASTLAVPGNHDYLGGSPAAFAVYFPQPSPGQRYFRVRHGEWWLIGLDSNLRGQWLTAQMDWLRGELGAIQGDGRCLLAFWHHPVVSTGLHRSDGAPMEPAWRMLAAEGADLILSGHEHYYESFGPLDGEQHAAQQGVREFIVGTGGARLKDVSLAPWRHRAFALVHGVLELTLEPGSYGWRFIATNGEVLDRGDSRCRRPLQSR
jgi:hypothetical protein